MGNLSNIDIKKQDNKVVVKINPNIYPLDVIYSAAYVFLDRAYVLIDGDPKTKVIVELKPKEKKDLTTIGHEFDNELLNYASYKTFSEKNRDIRNMIIQRALLTNDPEIIIEHQKNNALDEETKKMLQEIEEEEDDDEEWFDDPEGIAIPWEEKFTKKDGKNNPK